MAKAIEVDWWTAPLDRRARAICEFAHRLTVDVAHQRSEHVEALRDVGLDDREILDVVQVAAYFNFVNRMAEGLGVELEMTRRG